MDQRRRDQREKRLKEDLEKYRKENPKITEQFADLKRKLADVSQSEWEAIPDIGDYTIKRQKLQARRLPVLVLTGSVPAFRPHLQRLQARLTGGAWRRAAIHAGAGLAAGARDKREGDGELAGGARRAGDARRRHHRPHRHRQGPAHGGADPAGAHGGLRVRPDRARRPCRVLSCSHCCCFPQTLCMLPSVNASHPV